MKKNDIRYGIYDITDNEVLVGIFTSREAVEYLHITLGSFYSTITRGHIVAHKYMIRKVIDDEILTNSGR